MITTITGKNEFIAQQSLRDIKAGWSKVEQNVPPETYEAEDITDADSFINELQTINLFNARRLVVLRHISDNKHLVELLERYGDKIPAEIHLVVYDPGLDLRTRIAKWLKQNSDWREAKVVDSRLLAQWLTQQVGELKLDMSASAQRKLLDLVGDDQMRLWQELQKLKLVTGKIDENTIETMVPRTLDDNIFDLLDAICRRDQTKAMQLMADFRQGKVDPHYVYNMLVWQFNIASVSLSSNKSPDTIAKESGLSQGALARARSLRSSLPPKRIGAALSLLADIDEKIRQGDAWQQIDRLLFS